LRKLPPPQGTDLRIDLGEAVLRAAASDYNASSLSVQVAEKPQQGASPAGFKARHTSGVPLCATLGAPKCRFPSARKSRHFRAEAGDRSERRADESAWPLRCTIKAICRRKKMYDTRRRRHRSIGIERSRGSPTDNATRGQDQALRIRPHATDQPLTLSRVGDQTGRRRNPDNLPPRLPQGDLAGAQKNFHASLTIGARSGRQVPWRSLNTWVTSHGLADLAGGKSASRESFATFSKMGTEQIRLSFWWVWSRLRRILRFCQCRRRA